MYKAPKIWQMVLVGISIGCLVLGLFFAILLLISKAAYGARPDTWAIKSCNTQSHLYRCEKIIISNQWRKNKGRWFMSWNEMFPNSNERKLIQSINRRDTLLWKDHILALPKANPPLSLLEYAPFSKTINESAGKVIVVDLNLLALGLYENGKLIRWDIANGGQKKKISRNSFLYHTHPGIWTVLRKGDYKTKSNLYPITCKNKKVCGFWMAWATFWHKDGTAIHFSKTLPGANVSHGCVRTTMETAKFINKWSDIQKTKIIIKEY